MWVPEGDSTPPKKTEQIVHLAIPAGTLAGYVEIDLIDAKSGRIKEHYEFSNVICTAGMDGMFNGLGLVSSMLQTLTIGTGSTTPSPDDTRLDEQVAASTSDGGIDDVFGYVTGDGGGQFDLGNPYHFIQRTRVFTEGEANFPTLAEIGFRDNNAPEFQFTRALIKDVNGVPITIAKTDQDQLRILYEIRGYPVPSHFFGEFVLAESNTSHSFTGSAIDIDRADKGRSWTFSLNVQSGPDPRGQFHQLGAWGGAMRVYASASVPGNPTGTLSDWGWTGAVLAPSESLSQPYVCGSFTRTKQATFEPSDASFGSGGIQGMAVRYPSNEDVLALYFTPSIKKTDLQRLVIAYSATATASLTSSL